MFKTKSTKRAFVMSVLSLVLCVSMFVGTTFAWFTDSVTSSNNIIKSGSLDVEMFWSNDNASWTDASAGAIFDYKYWEPGYTEVKYIKIKNVGDLAFKFQLNIIPTIAEAGEFKLADVIDVYMFGENEIVDRAAIDDATPVGTLADLMADADGAAYGTLLPNNGSDRYDVDDDSPIGAITYCVVLKMQESAGNDYQNLSVGEGFAVQLLATQYTWEKDTYGDDYDEDSVYDPNQAVPLANTFYMTDVIGVPTNNLNWNNNYSMVDGNDGVEFDTAYKFVAPVDGDVALESPYANWIADFNITFNRPITAEDEVGLAGEYGNWGWIGFTTGGNDQTAVELRDYVNNNLVDGVDLLASYTDSVKINYYELCNSVREFKCSTWAAENDADPLTITVELRLYETYTADEAYELFGDHSTNYKKADYETDGGDYYVVIGSYTYTYAN